MKYGINLCKKKVVNRLYLNRKFELKSDFSLNIFGEMSELAEGARLEIVCAVNSGTEGSNPSLSAK